MFAAFLATGTPARFSLRGGGPTRRGLPRSQVRTASVRASPAAPTAVPGDRRAPSGPDRHLLGRKPPAEGRHRGLARGGDDRLRPEPTWGNGATAGAARAAPSAPGAAPRPPEPGEGQRRRQVTPPGTATTAQESASMSAPARNPLTVCAAAARRPTGTERLADTSASGPSTGSTGLVASLSTGERPPR